MAEHEKSISAVISVDSVLSADILQPVGLTGTLSAAQSTYERDYEQLKNLPKINDITLSGNKTFEDLGLSELTALDVFKILDKVWEE